MLSFHLSLLALVSVYWHYIMYEAIKRIFKIPLQGSSFETGQLGGFSQSQSKCLLQLIKQQLLFTLA